MLRGVEEYIGPMCRYQFPVYFTISHVAHEKGPLTSCVVGKHSLQDIPRTSLQPLPTPPQHRCRNPPNLGAVQDIRIWIKVPAFRRSPKGEHVLHWSVSRRAEIRLCRSPDSFDGYGVVLHPRTQKLCRHRRRRLKIECLARQQENLNGHTGLRNPCFSGLRINDQRWIRGIHRVATTWREKLRVSAYLRIWFVYDEVSICMCKFPVLTHGNFCTVDASGHNCIRWQRTCVETL